MAESTDTQQQPTQDLAAQIAALTAAMQAQPQSKEQQGGIYGWGRPPVPQVQAQPTGVLIPVGVDSSAGSVTIQLSFPAEFATPDKLVALVETLISNGVPVKAWQKKESWGGNKRSWGR